MHTKYKEIIKLFEDGFLTDNDPNGLDYVKGHNHALNRVITYLQQLAIKDINSFKQQYGWTSVKNAEPLSCCILDVILTDENVYGLRETYPAYKNAKDSDEWYILFSDVPIKKVAGNFKIMFWMPFPEPNV